MTTKSENSALGFSALGDAQPDEAEETRRGELSAEILNLKRNETYPDCFLTEWGDKTALGLFRTLKRIVIEGK